METKICSECGRELLVEMFYKQKSNKDGLKGMCKECYRKHSKQYSTQYYENNKNKKKECSKQYYENNKNKVLERQKKYCENNKDKVAEKNKRWNEVNKEKNKEKYEKNKEKYEEYYKENKEKRLLYKKQYYKNNPEAKRIENQKHKARKRKTPRTLTIEQWEQTKKYFNNCCAYCGKELSLEQDHFIPLSKGGGYTVNNIIPSCRSCNSSKYNKDFFKWYPKFKYYSKEKEKHIIKFLEH